MSMKKGLWRPDQTFPYQPGNLTFTGPSGAGYSCGQKISSGTCYAGARDPVRNVMTEQLSWIFDSYYHWNQERAATTTPAAPDRHDNSVRGIFFAGEDPWEMSSDFSVSFHKWSVT
jgi:hypothetical protein